MSPSTVHERISRVRRSKEQAKSFYTQISSVYDLFSGPFEQRYRTRGLELLGIQQGESVLEIGFGTGTALQYLAEKVGEAGKVYGVDIAPGMVKIAHQRLMKARVSKRVDLTRTDAVQLPYADNAFDAVFMSFTLELFDTPGISKVLREIKRVLQRKGRLGVVSLSKKDALVVSIYEWMHRLFPKYLDCRPLFVKEVLETEGFTILQHEEWRLFGLPIEIMVSQI